MSRADDIYAKRLAGSSTLEAMHTYARELEARVAELERLLTRYRTETPLGHQPHMIAHEADSALTRLAGPTPLRGRVTARNREDDEGRN